MKMWAGRFRQPLDPGFERWQRSFEFDRRLLAYEIAASRAHARALKNAGIVSSDELISILQGLDQITEQAAMSPAFLDDDEAEDVHHFVEKQLVVMIGDVGYKLHSGRSRNEQIATDLRLYVRASIDDLRLKLAEWLDALVSRAEQAGNAAMPAYTHLRRAEPVLVSHWVLAYVEMFLRDAERLADCRARVNICPLGSGAVAGTTIHLDRRAIAEALGFDAVTSNSVDATSDRDFVLEFVNALTLLSLHLSRWAEEMIIFSSQELDSSTCRKRIPPAAARCRRRRILTYWNWCAERRRGLSAMRLLFWLPLKGCRSLTTKTCRKLNSLFSMRVKPYSRFCL